MVSANSNQSNLALAIMCLGCLLTVLSQFISGLSSVFILIWFSFLMFEALKHRESIVLGRAFFVFLAIYCLFGVFCSLCYFASGISGYLFGIFQLVTKSILMYLVGLVAFSSIDYENQTLIVYLRFYCICAFIYSAWALVNYFPGLTAWLSSMEYLFASKNSLGQICGVGSLILICLGFNCENRVLQFIQLALGFLFWTVTAMFQCRAAMFGVILAGIFFLLIKGKRSTVLGALLIAIVCVCIFPSLQAILKHALLLDKYSSGGDISSGRLGLWSDAFVTLRGHELFGIGSFYVDNMYIDVLVNVGLFGAILVIGFWLIRLSVNFYRLFGCAFYSGQHKLLIHLVSVLSVFYIVESLLEGNPPFGPGACSFIFWMLCGYLDASAASSVRA